MSEHDGVDDGEEPAVDDQDTTTDPEVLARQVFPAAIAREWGMSVQPETVRGWLARGLDPVCVQARVYEVNSRGLRSTKVGPTIAVEEMTYDELRRLAGPGHWQVEFCDAHGRVLVRRRQRIGHHETQPSPAPAASPVAAPVDEPARAPEARDTTQQLLLEVLHEIRATRTQPSPAPADPMREAVASIVQLMAAQANSSQQLIQTWMQMQSAPKEHDPIIAKLVDRGLTPPPSLADQLAQLRELTDGNKADEFGWLRDLLEPLSALKLPLAAKFTEGMPDGERATLLQRLVEAEARDDDPEAG